MLKSLIYKLSYCGFFLSVRFFPFSFVTPNRLRDWPDFGLVVIDEAHHSTAQAYMA
jgi:superfamily II DNA or RNA helicase